MNARILLVGALICAGAFVSQTAAAQTADVGLQGAADALAAHADQADLGAPIAALQNSNSSSSGNVHVSGEIPAAAGADLGEALGSMVDPGVLAGAAGGPTIVSWTDQTLTATNSDNTLNSGGDVGSGPVTISSSAFSGFTGIGNFVINTGHLNNLQGSLSVNLVMAPPSGGQ